MRRLVRRIRGSRPRPFEQTVRKGDPKYGREQAQDDSQEHRFHLVLGRRFRNTLELNHHLYRPGKTFQAEQESRPGPELRNGPSPPPQKSPHRESPERHETLRDSALENPKPNGRDEGSQDEIQDDHRVSDSRVTGQV